MLIIFEGIDGSGKTTMAKKLTRHFRKKGKFVEFVSSSGYKPIGRLTDKIFSNKGIYDPKAHAFLSNANSLILIKSIIEPCLQQSGIVILDRYFPSMIAYSYAMGIELDWLYKISECLLRPSLVVYLDIAPEVALKRKKSKKLENFETNFSTENHDIAFLSFQAKVKKGYHEVFSSMLLNTVILKENKSREKNFASLLNELDI